MLWLRTALFTLVVPGTVLVFVPVALLVGGLGPSLHLGPARWAGVLPIALGLAVISIGFVEFIRLGRGTPAPYDPPRDLVVAGLYRYIRNPQYVGVFCVAIGEVVLTGAVVLLGYAILLAFAYSLLVRYYEEPMLDRRFGEAYARYREVVPRWLPRWPRPTEPS